jgi:hypothetical protein
MYTIKSLELTCSSCPLQLEGVLDTGQQIYIRYRHGYLSVRISLAPSTDIMDAVGGTLLYDSCVSPPDEFLEIPEIKARLAHLLIFPPSFLEFLLP